MSTCIRCAGNSSRRVIKHLTIQLTTTQFLSYLFLFPFSLFTIWVSFILHLSSPTHSLHLPADRIRSLRYKSTLFAQSPYSPSRASFKSPTQGNPHSLSKYACPKLRSHAFEQDVLGCPRPPGHLYDHRDWNHIQLRADDRDHWC